jgi:hypothetical protein
MENNNLKFYSPEENEIEKLNVKVSKLESKLKKIEKENTSLKAQINNLENIVTKICTNLKIANNLPISPSTNKKNEDEEIEESWFYYIKPGITQEKIISSLSLSKNIKESIIIEINISDWNDEKLMLIEILKNFKNYQEFQEDWETMDLKTLKEFTRSLFSNSFYEYNTILILRNFPLKNHKKYEQILSNVATLAGILYNSYEEIESENVGKMALILESEEIIQILNILKNQDRVILLVDSLFEN